MKKPWEERWVPHPDLAAVLLEDGRAVGDFDRVLWDDEPGAREARARLAAAAPAMWRLLSRIEWAGANEEASSDSEGSMHITVTECCPECRCSYSHAPDCEWLAIAKEVGYRK
jgi:hypothetical protein